MTIAPAELRAAKALLRQHRREQRKGRVRAKPGRVLDPGYLSWLHDGLPCIACLIEGSIWNEIIGRPYTIEAAHQKYKGPALGKKSDDADACPLCAWHHRLGPGCCDPAQRKFWDRLRVDAGAFCQALFAAYKAGADGLAVIMAFAQREEEPHAVSGPESGQLLDQRDGRQKPPKPRGSRKAGGDGPSRRIASRHFRRVPRAKAGRAD